MIQGNYEVSRTTEICASMEEICDLLLMEVIVTMSINQEGQHYPGFQHLSDNEVMYYLQYERAKASGRQQTPQQLTHDVLDPVSIEFINQNPDDFPVHKAFVQALLEKGVTVSMWKLAWRFRSKDFAMHSLSCDTKEYISVAEEYSKIKRLDDFIRDGCVALAAKVARLMEGEHDHKEGA
jgi:hypothetical protein